MNKLQGKHTPLQPQASFLPIGYIKRGKHLAKTVTFHFRGREVSQNAGVVLFFNPMGGEKTV